MPLPRPETTPPVTKIYFVITAFLFLSVYLYVARIFSAIVRLVTQRSIAWRSMNLCASFSVILSWSIRIHFARLTSRISSIFPPVSRSSAPCGEAARGWHTEGAVWKRRSPGFGRLLRVMTPLAPTLAETSGYCSARTSRRTPDCVLSQMSSARRVAEFVRQRRIDDQKIKTALQKTSPRAGNVRRLYDRREAALRQKRQHVLREFLRSGDKQHTVAAL